MLYVRFVYICAGVPRKGSTDGDALACLKCILQRLLLKGYVCTCVSLDFFLDSQECCEPLFCKDFQCSPENKYGKKVHRWKGEKRAMLSDGE